MDEPVSHDEVRVYPRGRAIVTKGEPGDCMFVVLSGRAGVELSRGGRVVFEVGDFFGEMAVIDEQVRSATVTALEDNTRVLPIDQARFVYLVSHQPAFALGVMSGLSTRLRGTGASLPPPVRLGVDAAYSATEIQSGLWQLRSRGRACNVYLVAGRNRTVLIDTGLASSYLSMAQALREIGHPPESIDLVVLTHEHADHVGGMASLPGRPTIAAHPLAANKLELRDDFATVSGVIGEEVGSFQVDLCLTETSVIDVPPFRFEVLHTPGHTSGCICLADPANDLLICGDTFMAGGAMGGIFASGNISDYILSLQRLERLGLNTALAGHGRASDRGKQDAGVALARARTLLQNTRELFQAMGGTGSFEKIMASLRELNR